MRRGDASLLTEWWRPAPAAQPGRGPAGRAGAEAPSRPPRALPPAPSWAARPAAGRTLDLQAVSAAAPGGTLPFVALTAFSFVLLLAPQQYLPALAPLRLALVAAAIAIGAHVSSAVMSGRPVSIRTREITLVGALGVWSLVTVPFSLWPGGSLALMTGIFFKSLALFGLNANLVTTARRLKVLAWLFALAGVPLALTAMRHAAEGRLAGGSGEAVKRIAGYEAPLTANPNDMALMLNLLLPFAAALAILDRRPLVKAILWGIVVLDAVGVVLTYSRGGFLTLMTLGAILLFDRLKGKWIASLLIVPAVLVAALTLWLVPPSYLQHMETITDYRSDPTGSAQARLADMITATGIALRHPFIGAGLGMNTLALDQARGHPAWKMVHDVYLQYAVDLGLLGAGLFIALYFCCLGSAGKAARGPGGPPGSDAAAIKEYGRALRNGLIAFGVAAIFHPVAYHFYFYGMGGLAVAVGRLSEGSPHAAS
ncbi:MAG TPA: O-antigen ligase family protein [Candidatus Polarisedimenticolia bacterium]|nr:O-antigen ligase family protein [Candidatus Polarisedimenticolia bacterium]